MGPRIPVCRSLAALAAAVLAGSALSMVGTGSAEALPPCWGADPAPICSHRFPPPPAPLPARPDLQVGLAGNPASVPQNGVVHLTATVTDPASTSSAYRSAAASGVTLNLTVPTGAYPTAATGTGGFACTIGFTATVTCTGGAVAVGGAATVTVTATMHTPTGARTSTAMVDPGNTIAERVETNNQAWASTTVTAGPDLTVSMTGPAAVQGVYAVGTWTMTIRNVGVVPASDVLVRWLTDWGGWVNANAYVSGGFHCYPPAEYMLQTVECLTPTLAAGQSATITINAVPPDPSEVGTGDGRSTVSATADPWDDIAETNEQNNTAVVATTIT